MLRGVELFKGREINYDKPVDVYRCLNRKGRVFSIRQQGLVVAHCTVLDIKDVKFVVNNSGKQRAIKSMQRNVHAFIRGMIGTKDLPKTPTMSPLKYNPFSNRGFCIEEQDVKSSPMVCVRPHGIYAVKPFQD